MTIPMQIISLDHNETVAVYTEGGRVFYDLDALVVQFQETVVANVEHGTEHGCMNEAARHYLLGQLDMLEAIHNNADSLSLEYSFSRESANRE